MNRKMALLIRGLKELYLIELCSCMGQHIVKGKIVLLGRYRLKLIIVKRNCSCPRRKLGFMRSS